VYKDMWRERWESGAATAERQAAALMHSGLATYAVRSYQTAYRAHLNYYNGINLLTLARLLKHVAEVTSKRAAMAPELDLDEIATVVRAGARAALERNGDPADADDAVWAAATLGELAVIDGDAGEAESQYRAACVPGVSYFQLDSMVSQLNLYAQLGFHKPAVEAALAPLRAPLDRLPNPVCRYDMVLVASGHMIDTPDRPSPRFPPALEARVRERIATELDAWEIGEHGLAICGGARMADILVAEACPQRGAHVRLSIATPEPDFLASSVRLAGSDWEDRYFALQERCEIVYQAERLGAAPAGTSVYARNNRWIVNSARAEADADSRGGSGQRLRALLVWDEQSTGDGPGGTSDFAAAVRGLGGRLRIVNPTQLHD
jgi:hypothetical protein